MILYVFGCEPDEGRLFARYAAHDDLDVQLIGEALTPCALKGVAPGGLVSVSHKQIVDAALLRAMAGRGVSYLCSRSVGLDHIDLDAARQQAIVVENAPYAPDSVAEYTLMLMLMALRGAADVLRRADRLDFQLPQARGRTLKDMTVGVIGAGRIGGAVLRLLSGFGCRTLAYDPRSSAMGGACLDDVLRSSDLVTLHLPLTEATRGIINRQRIARMRKGAILINTARGALVDQRALYGALASGALAYAALDVVEGEEGWFYRDCSAEQPPFSDLLALPNVVVTPHAAYYTQQALDDVVKQVIQGAINYVGGLKRWVG